MGFYLLFSLVVLALLSALQKSPFLITVESAQFNSLTDKEALLSFKSLIISDPSNTLSSWNDYSSPCNWTGVSCHKVRQRVSGIDLRGLGLVGSITPNIGNLSLLRFLHLQNNKLTGFLPGRIADLFRLKVLNVSSNSIEGSLPLNLSRCLELTVLEMSGNMISGQIPTDLGLLPKLQVLTLSRNLLFGEIPPSIGNITTLTTLELATNSLHGTIPTDIGRLQNLKHLQISLNSLTGTLPISLYNISSLITFAFASNQLWGEFPNDFALKLPNMLLFHSCFNKFTGAIPQSLNNLTKIQSIRMSHNFHVGSVPEGLGNLPELRMYNVGFNRLVSTGDDGLSFITSLTNSTKLEFLALDENLFEGVLPESVGNLAKGLTKFYMGGNQIYGDIPPSIGRLSNLALLNLSYNFISGELPKEIGQLQLLQILDLARNAIAGVIPASLGNLSNLNELQLFGNDLEGGIPTSFGNYQSLLSLDLSNNKLNGTIPKEVLSLTSMASFLNLSKNSLTGPLPQEVGKLEQVAVIDISSNRLSGSIPNSIGDCRSLQDLFMANNLFSGPIPLTLGGVKGLQNLDLSMNQLSGTIPNDFQKLQALQSLNLSFNNLEGEVPKTGIFRNLSQVHLEGNSKLCTSSICDNSRVPSCHGRRSCWHNRSVILLIVIPTAGFIILCFLVGLKWVFFSKRKHATEVAEMHESFKGMHQMVSYEGLLIATDYFSQTNLVGRGSFGSVYKGILSNGMTVAVKVLDLIRKGASKSFLAECEALKNVRHRNLVKLITSCSTIDFRNIDFQALVYEFMNNGSLDDWVQHRRRHESGYGLSVMERLNIAIDVASAMDYLHHDCEAPVVHCDLKPSNVLLNEEMTAKVGDFGLAKLLVEEGVDQQSKSTTHGLKGSIGYIPPEYGMGGKPSMRGDVYSYGVMLLELFTGKSPTDNFFVGDLSLYRWVYSAFSNNILDVLDPELLPIDDFMYKGQPGYTIKQQECLISILGVGLSCALDLPEARISMRDVLQKLKGIKDALIKRNLMPVSSSKSPSEPNFKK
ncbi:uncharacterized protein LOC143862455 [Tasmannia lanceolata]|uniref:uncharacterized protein LOC143862455 n=1 Tax=Tasmannia lanceolata TaxID=3420 RepID=UPI004063D940